MVKVKVNASDELDRALKLFKKICNNAGIFKEIKRLSYYEKPSERKRREEDVKKRNIMIAQKRASSPMSFKARPKRKKGFGRKPS